MEILRNHSLQSYNTFKLPASAAYFAHISSVEEMLRLMDSPFYANDRLILGGGSNLLFTRDYPGLVIQVGMKGISVMREDGQEAIISVAAGEVWHEVVMHCVAQGWGGIENLALIPGLAGAAPIQNIGAYGVELKDVFEYAKVVDLETGEVVFMDGEACSFGYRDSVFKGVSRGKYLITSVVLRLKKNRASNVTYGSLNNYLAARFIKNPSINEVAAAVIAIRQSKLPDPKLLGNAGSFFKNPVVTTEKYAELLEKYPKMVAYPISEDEVKLAAGWLIEAAGWKGKRVGGCGVHEKQALVLVNYGAATGGDIFALSQEIVESIAEKFGVQLEREVNVI